MPPWMSFVERPDVPLAKSSRSTSATLRPRVVASHATPAPTHPPPTTTTSNSSARSRASCDARDGGENGVTDVPSSHAIGDSARRGETAAEGAADAA